MEDIVYQPSNRERRLEPKKGKYWCGGCDRCLVGDGEKCPVCGTRNGTMRLKKMPPK